MICVDGCPSKDQLTYQITNTYIILTIPCVTIPCFRQVPTHFRTEASKTLYPLQDSYAKIPHPLSSRFLRVPPPPPPPPPLFTLLVLICMLHVQCKILEQYVHVHGTNKISRSWKIPFAVHLK